MITIEELSLLPYPNNLEAMGLHLLEPYKGSKIHHRMKCGDCSHEWSATPLSKIQAYKKYLNRGCPKCTYSKRYGTASDNSKKAIEDRGFEILSDGPIRHTTTMKIKVRNLTCGHVFESAPGNLLHRNVQCPVCADVNRKDLNRERNKQRRDEWLLTATEWEQYESKCRILTRDIYKGNKAIINPNNYTTGVAGTQGAYHLDHIVSVRVGFDKNIPPELICHVQNLQMVPWQSNIANKDKIKFIPRIFKDWFNCDFIHAFEDMLFKCGFIVDYESPHPFCYIKGRIVVVYCDFERFVERTTYRKGLCINIANYYKEKNCRCVFVFEDEFVKNPNLISKKIKHISGMNYERSRIHARSCTIQEIKNPALKRAFLNEHHVQGDDRNAQLSYGAFFNDQLIAIMTFSSSRNQKIKNDIGVWELVRFATNTDYRIPGIASRLLAMFQHSHPSWGRIYSYADRRWSDGNLYETIGFINEVTNPPGYWYIIDGKRYHRSSFQKSKLTHWENFDPNKTEFQMTSERGIPRIWDCGTIRYAMYNGETNK